MDQSFLRRALQWGNHGALEFCLICLLAGLVALSPTGAVFAGPVEDGLTAAARGDYATALRLWRPLAERGDVNAQLYVGLSYAHGRGVPIDDATAALWYRMAAERGNAEAQVDLGVAYESGRGVTRDLAKSVELYRRACQGGVEQACEWAKRLGGP